jgi:hypothetical protein
MDLNFGVGVAISKLGDFKLYPDCILHVGFSRISGYTTVIYIQTVPVYNS